VDSNWTMVMLMAALTGTGVYVGRLCFERWFNPLSAYSAIWGFCLFNYELKLIQYYPIRMWAWVYIATAWAALYLGAFVVLLLSSRFGRPANVQLQVDLVRLKKAIVVLSIVGAAGTAGQMFVVIRNFGGGIDSLLLNANEIYVARISNQVTGLPYAGAFSLAACVFAGVCVSKCGRFTLTTLIPIVLVALQLLFLMGRGALGLAAVLFLASALHTPRDRRANPPRWQRIVGVVLVAILLGAVFGLVSSVRGLGVDYPGVTPALEEISDYVPVAPSIYSNFSGTPVAFSMYLYTPDESKHGFWGMYTFAPIFRLLSKFGMPTSVPSYEEDYWTPFPMNGSTYLKNLHSDFGPLGIIVFPFLLGVITTFLTQRIRAGPRLLDIVVLTNIYVILVFSFGMNFMLSGDWYICMVVSVVTALIVGRRHLGTKPPQNGDAAKASLQPI
jgi:oligosaccharide repeat unit polymerase